jgi:DNA-binding beta-propeller fold protein YncE
MFLGIIAMLSRIGKKTNLNRKTSKKLTVLVVLTLDISVGSFFGVAGNLTKAAYAQETHNFVRGIVAKSLSTSATGSGAFNNLTGIAVEPLSRFVYLVDNGSNSILLFSVDGKFLTKWGSSGSGDGQFKSPCGIAVEAHSGFVYVADSGNNRVQVFDKDGKFLTKWGSSGSGDGQFKSPCGIAVDSIENNVYVQDNGNNRVQVFNSNGKFLTKWSIPGS